MVLFGWITMQFWCIHEKYKNENKNENSISRKIILQKKYKMFKHWNKRSLNLYSCSLWFLWSLFVFFDVVVIYLLCGDGVGDGMWRWGSEEWFYFNKQVFICWIYFVFSSLSFQFLPICHSLHNRYYGFVISFPFECFLSLLV